MRRLTFLKGQATLSDFVIIEDHHGMQELSAQFVRQLCDRRGGIGADGVLRVVRAGQVKGWTGDPGLWYMDARRSNGDVADDCGNGLRLFARYLMNEQLVSGGRFAVATGTGTHEIRVARGGMVSVNLGTASVLKQTAEVGVGSKVLPATVIDVGGTQLVCFVEPGALEALDVNHAPLVLPVENTPDWEAASFLHVEAPDRLRARVHKRHVGEVVSCGVAAVAAVAAHRQAHAGPTSVSVDMPGGTLQVDCRRSGVWLTGPAVINMRGEFWV